MVGNCDVITMNSFYYQIQENLDNVYQFPAIPVAHLASTSAGVFVRRTLGPILLWQLVLGDGSFQLATLHSLVWQLICRRLLFLFAGMSVCNLNTVIR